MVNTRSSYVLEKFKKLQEFDEEVGRWLSDLFGETSERELKENIEEVKRTVNPKMADETKSWRPSDAD